MDDEFCDAVADEIIAYPRISTRNAPLQLSSWCIVWCGVLSLGCTGGDADCSPPENRAGTAQKPQDFFSAHTQTQDFLSSEEICSEFDKKVFWNPRIVYSSFKHFTQITSQKT